MEFLSAFIILQKNSDIFNFEKRGNNWVTFRGIYLFILKKKGGKGKGEKRKKEEAG